MLLIEQIKVDQVAARKSGQQHPASLLTTLLGEARMVGKNARNGDPTDLEVIAVVKKFISHNNDTIKVLTNQSSIDNLNEENEILSKYLPAQLSETEIYDILTKAFSAPYEKSSKGLMMKYLKDHHNGTYDGKNASSIVERIINNEPTGK